MRIGLDLRTTGNRTGISQYGDNLSDFLVASDSGDGFVKFFVSPERVPIWTSQVADRLAFGRAKLDLLHILGGGAPLGYREPYVITVHDLLIYRHPEWFPDGQWLSTKVVFPLSVKRARAIIVPSLATKNDLLQIFRVPEERITVIPHGVRACPKGALTVPKADFIVCLGTIEPRKNIATIIAAFRRLIDRNPELSDLELVVAGAVGWKSEETVDLIRKTQCEGYRIRLTGQVDEEEKWRLLAAAKCLVCPSFAEGFGLTVLEAFSAGAPAVVSDIPVLREVAGEAALYADPFDVGDWTEKIKMAVTGENLASELRVRGLSRAAQMGWANAAALTLETYRRAVR
jgi:glycosyltransferase involved in cell wall biosynthesis